MENISFEWDDSLEARSFVGYLADRNWIVWSFRGTETVLNWLEDFDFKLVNYSTHQAACGDACRVHQGFYGTYSVLAAALFDRYKALAKAHPTASTFITGHSLGAAQAEFALVDVVAWRNGDGATVSLYNYGAPRTGNLAFAQWAAAYVAASGATYYRVVHNNDIVPMLPPPLLGFEQFTRSFIWYAPEVPPPGYVACNDTGVQLSPIAPASQAGSGSCGASSVFKANHSDHDYYLGVHMACEL